MALMDRIRDRQAPELPDWAKDVLPQDAHAQHSPVDLSDSYEMIPREQIEVWDANPGKGIRTQQTQELRDDILSNRANGGGWSGTGIEQPLTVRPIGENKYVLLYGERRYNATDGTAVTHLPCLIRHINENEALEQSIREALHSENWSAVQEGEALVKYMAGMNHYNAPRGYKQTAKDFGVSEGFIRSRVRAAQAPDDVQQMLSERPDALSHVEYLMKVGDTRKRRELIRQTQQGASVAEISRQVAAINQKPVTPSHRIAAPVSDALPPRPAYDGITKAGEIPLQSTLNSRTVVLDAAPDITAIAVQAAALWRQIAQSGVEYSTVARYADETKAAWDLMKMRERK